MLQDDEDTSLASSTDKGKGKEREEFGLSHNPRSSPNPKESSMYPPVSEDVEETRRVEEVVSNCMLLFPVLFFVC